MMKFPRANAYIDAHRSPRGGGCMVASNVNAKDAAEIRTDFYDRYGVRPKRSVPVHMVYTAVLYYEQLKDYADAGVSPSTAILRRQNRLLYDVIGKQWTGGRRMPNDENDKKSVRTYNGVESVCTGFPDDWRSDHPACRECENQFEEEYETCKTRTQELYGPDGRSGEPIEGEEDEKEVEKVSTKAETKEKKEEADVKDDSPTLPEAIVQIMKEGGGTIVEVAEEAAIRSDTSSKRAKITARTFLSIAARLDLVEVQEDADTRRNVYSLHE